MNKIEKLLCFEYGITATNITPAVGGWSAAAYKIDSEHGEYFLKVYDKKRSGIPALLEKLDLCMSVASWLEDNTGLKGKINAPVLTKQGCVKSETEDHTYLLFSYIDGITPRTTPLTVSQQKELAGIVGELHRHGADMPFDFTGIQESFEIPCDELIKMPHKPSDPLCVYQQRDMLMQAINKAHKLAEYVKNEQLPFVLCHTDIHGWNLMQNDKLILIDWESIKLAPAEADSYTFWGDWYWGDSKWGSYWDTFLPVYKKYHPGYIYRDDVLRFYQIRRHIEDINDFYRQYLYDDMSDEETAEVITCLERECAFLSELIK